MHLSNLDTSSRQEAMSVISTTFGAVRLTGDDAKKFRDQLTHGKPSAAARETVKYGRQLVRDAANGSLTIEVRPRR